MTDTHTKHYRGIRGLVGNNRTRNNAFKFAADWLLGDLIVEFGTTNGLSKGKEILNDVSLETFTYVEGSKQPMLDKIDANSHADFSTTRKNTVITKLDIILQ